ncbi:MULTISPECIES: helix-turn-helix domain-containing protein [Comamonas]|uniref:helix-turn-helix domain-containing protein n=1 Tax=Comamonas TaxID=283 RepID=UPI002580B684|nr:MULTISPECIES: helix-turn-helix transcriptional regulator [Comamonas]
MNENFCDLFGDRIKSERLRLNIQQLAFAEACEVSRGALLKWEKNESTPNAQALALMNKLGVDVLFVVTGKHADESEATLAPAERALLQAWRDSGEKGRAALAAVAEVLKPE